jgi:hypothetical protein
LLVSATVVVVQIVAVFAGAVFISGPIRHLVRRRLQTVLIPESVKTLIENLATVAIYIFAFTVLLALWGVTWSTLLTAIGVSTLVVALGFQTVLQSLVGGIFVLFERPYNVGDRIQIAGQVAEGTVEEIGIRTTIIRSDTGDRIVTPNSIVFTNSVINRSPDLARHTIVTFMGVGRPDMTDEALEARVSASLAGIPGLDPIPEVTVKHRLGWMAIPKRLTRIRWVGRSVGRVRQSAIDRTTNVRVHWWGTSDRAVREEVLRQLKELFPEARVSMRRW